MTDFWNKRYSDDEYVYGELPNEFFADQLKQLKPGKILFACEGEGRNAVYAASKNWETYAFDSSLAGKEKADHLAEKFKVAIDYKVNKAEDVEYDKQSFDVIVFIFAHLPEQIRKNVHQKAIQWLKPDGLFVLEAFNKKQIDNTSGGPKNEAMLYSTSMLQNDLSNLQIQTLEEKQVNLNEGKYHQGKADVIRLIATKKEI
jgi:2-polyprenyl-3-methyl-5-hydroxy-6-metoxy-1,4-benzoquinol methylase